MTYVTWEGFRAWEQRVLRPWELTDPNPFPRFHLFGRRKPAQPPRCTGDPCICTNGIGCVTVPMELW